MAYMADVYASARCPCHIDDILRRNILGPYVMGIQEIPDLLLVGLAFFCLRFLLPLQYLAELFTVESAQSAVWLQDL